MTSREFVNWDGTLSWRPERCHQPSTETEIQQIVRAAVEQGRRVKAVGSSLSWSDIADIPEAVITLEKMNRVFELNREQHTVRVQAGALLSDVNEQLAANGLAFDNFGSIVLQTAGGYTGSGTHGTGGRTRILSADIIEMRLVDGTGQLRVLSADDDPALFSAARVHLGALGVVTELTFRCVQAFDLEERLELMAFDDALSDLERLVSENDYLKLWWLPYSDQIQVYRFNRTSKQRTSFSITEWLDTSGFSSKVFTGLLALSRRTPRVIPKLHRAIQAIQFKPHTRVDRSDKIIRYAGTIPKHQEMEYAIPRERAAEAIERVRQAVLNAASYRVNFPLEVRFTAADDIPMSPTTGRDSCWIGAYVASLDWAPRYFAEFEELMLDFGGRPHWGKTFMRTAGQLRDLYPHYDDFNAQRKACDPHGIFRNRFVDRVFAD